MNDESVKESRRILRRVQDHLTDVHLTLGVVQESHGLVDVFYHHTNPLPALNYVTPRQKTSWIPGEQVEIGLQRLAALDRSARVQYIEGLFPAPFAATLRKLGLQSENEQPLMVYTTDGLRPAPPPMLPAPPSSVSITVVDDARSAGIWWYVYRNALYDVVSTGVDPFLVGWELAAIASGGQVNILAYRYGFPVGALRMTLGTTSAHIAALAQMKDGQAQEIRKLMVITALKTALARGCTLVFAADEDDIQRKLYRDLGFVDSGTLVCYAAKDEQRIAPSGNAAEATTPQNTAQDVAAQTIPTTNIRKSQEEFDADDRKMAQPILPVR